MSAAGGACLTPACPTRAAMLRDVRAALRNIWADPVIVQSVFTAAADARAIERAQARRIERRLSCSALRGGGAA